MLQKSKRNLKRLFVFNPKDFEPLSDEYRRPGGVNSEIRYIRESDGRILVQARYGAKKGGMTYLEASRMVEHLDLYQDLLEKSGVSMPKIYGMVIEHDVRTGRAVLSKTCLWTGYDFQELLERVDVAADPELIRFLVKGMCKLLVGICKSRYRGWETRVGIDARCSNFTVDGNGKTWFIDLFPPRFRIKGRPMVEWPAPKTELGRQLGHFKHFDVRGIILSAASQLARVRPEYREFLEQEVILGIKPALSKRELKEFETGLSQAPWRIIRDWLQGNASMSPAQFSKVLKMPVFGINYGIYAWRDAAIEFAAQGIISHQELEQFFRDSHFEDRISKAQEKQLLASLNAMYKRAAKLAV